mmetsp:Transcript_62222/g.165203  ORF Transcript_62222/g.165203 Transcript_62222/m.165203 type:complete len:248 (-) Transcript_62222:443-1186(-)
MGAGTSATSSPATLSPPPPSSPALPPPWNSRNFNLPVSSGLHELQDPADVPGVSARVEGVPKHKVRRAAGEATCCFRADTGAGVLEDPGEGTNRPPEEGSLSLHEYHGHPVAWPSYTPCTLCGHSQPDTDAAYETGSSVEYCPMEHVHACGLVIAQADDATAAAASALRQWSAPPRGEPCLQDQGHTVLGEALGDATLWPHHPRAPTTGSPRTGVCGACRRRRGLLSSRCACPGGSFSSLASGCAAA